LSKIGRRKVVLPPTLVPRGLSRDEAAAYLGIGATLFDDLVKEGKMPQPRALRGAVRWDRHELDVAFVNLPRKGESGEPADDEDDADDPWSRARA